MQARVRQGGFFSELKRRRVWRVAGAYVLVVWMAVEIMLETFPLFGFADWVQRAVVVLAFLGFPLTVVLAWAFDITPQGVVRTAALEPSASAPDPAGPERAPVTGGRVVVQARPTRLAGVFGAGILVALVGFGAYSAFVPGAIVRPEAIEALAVLPFEDLSEEQDQGYFADGVTEELINRLARVGDLRVAARTSSFVFKDMGAPLDEIGRRLGVDAVVVGSVRRDGDRLRINVELVDVASGFQIWSDKYDRQADDIFAIQDDISSAIVDALRLQLVPSASKLRAGTGSVRAHDAYLLGLARWHARTEADLLRALEYFEEAVAEDDSYALAQAGLALTYAVLPAYTGIPADVAAERGSEAAARALALNAQQAEAHAAIGQIAQSLEWNLEAAEMAYQRAIQFQPSYATGHQWYGEALLMMGRLAEAEHELRTALDLDPLSVSARTTMGYLQTVRRDYAGARATYAGLLEANPGYTLGHTQRFLLCLVADCHEEAAAAVERAFPAELAPALTKVVWGDADPAYRAEAVAALRALQDRLPPAQLALLYAALGDGEAAMERLALAYEEGEDPNLPFYLVHPLFDVLRQDARFRDIAESIGVEAPTARLRV